MEELLLQVIIIIYDIHTYLLDMLSPTSHLDLSLYTHTTIPHTHSSYLRFLAFFNSVFYCSYTTSDHRTVMIMNVFPS